MFAATLGGQISWLIPFAAIALIATLILIGRRPQDRSRAGQRAGVRRLVRVLSSVVLSFQQGTQHPYYTSAMAPPIAALTGIGAVALYQACRRSALVEPGAAGGGRGHRRVGLRAAAPDPELERRGCPGRSPEPPIVAVLALALGWLRSRRSGQTRDGAAAAPGRVVS